MIHFIGWIWRAGRWIPVARRVAPPLIRAIARFCGVERRPRIRAARVSRRSFFV